VKRRLFRLRGQTQRVADLRTSSNDGRNLLPASTH
jgi:hypothetical protein